MGLVTKKEFNDIISDRRFADPLAPVVESDEEKLENKTLSQQRAAKR